MDTFFSERDESASLGIVFFSNDFVRALDAFRDSRERPDALGNLCDKAISSLHGLHRPDSGSATSPTGLMSTADEVATLAISLERHFGVTNSEEANHAIERVMKAISRIKTQKEFTEDLKQKVDEVLSFFERLASEGLMSCRRQASGETTEAEKVWRHYAMSS